MDLDNEMRAGCLGGWTVGDHEQRGPGQGGDMGFRQQGVGVPQIKDS